jgi:hypothetical protein
MSFETVIQKAIYEKLFNDAAIIATKAPVYDDVPQADDSGSPKVFPYIVVGDDSLVIWDTDTEIGMDAVITIHTWSRKLGKKEIKSLQGLIYDALHRVDLVIPGYKSVVCAFQNSNSFLDADGKTRHGVQAFTMLIERTKHFIHCCSHIGSRKGLFLQKI